MASNPSTSVHQPIDIDAVGAALGNASAIIDLIFTLASTGDIEGLDGGTLSTATGHSLELIEEARCALADERAAARSSTSRSMQP